MRRLLLTVDHGVQLRGRSDLELAEKLARYRQPGWDRLTWDQQCVGLADALRTVRAAVPPVAWAS